MEPVSPEAVTAWAKHLGSDATAVDPASLRHDLASGNLTDAFDAASAAAGSHARLRIGDEEVSHEQAHRSAASTASVLAELGVRHGSRLVFCASTSVRFVIAYLAALRLGATVVLANPSYPPADLHRLATRSRAVLVVADDDLAGALSPDCAVAPLDDITARAASAPERAPAAITSDNIALLAYTSGTTGDPKGVPLSHGMLLASIRSAMQSWRWTASDTLVHALPLFHQHGLSGLHATLLAGSRAIMLSKFDPGELISVVDREQATVVFAVPSIHQRLAELGTDELAPLRRLRLLTSGSAPLSPALADALVDKLGFAPLERYGLTESGLDVSNPYDGERRIGTVGVPLPGVEVGLFDATGSAVAAGDDGEIVLRGPQIFDGYLDDPDATRAAFWPDGWFRTGDLGRWSDDGYLTITGRLKELIISGGMNIAPREVELALEQHASVEEAAVAGMPSERWGEEVAAWVVPHDATSFDADALIAHCREHLAPYKCPKQVFALDVLPRNAMGKIARSDLAPTASGASE